MDTDLEPATAEAIKAAALTLGDTSSAPNKVKGMAEDSVSIITPDPHNGVERNIHAAWALAALTVLAGVGFYALKLAGFVFLPPDPGPSDYARAMAFVIACINFLCWVWFPLEDIRVVKMWVKTRKTAFPARTSEFLGMAFVTFLLLFFIVSSTISALAFGITGTAIYLVNLIGFEAVRRQICRAVNEAKRNYSMVASVEKRKCLLNG